MNREQLVNVQQPLKDRYRSEPEAALVTLRAEGTLGEDVSCSLNTGRAVVSAGLHPAIGGDGSRLCSGDMLLEALAACAGVTLRAVATSLEIPVTGRVIAEGDLDFRGTLGVDRNASVGSPTSGSVSISRAPRTRSNSRSCSSSPSVTVWFSGR